MPAENFKGRRAAPVPEGELKVCAVMLRIAPDVKETLEHAARARGLLLGQYLRAHLYDYAVALRAEKKKEIA